jgi:1D-myo-inositol-tetrakisphosphate 5-kinase/inositol-polyphosphate multikinase
MTECVKGIRDAVQEIRDVLLKAEVRIVNCSVLIVYEADRARAEEIITQRRSTEEDKSLAEDASSVAETPPDSEVEEDEDEGGTQEGSDSDLVDEDEEEEEEPPELYRVKLIDFAHARAATGEGPDPGLLKGLDTVLSLLDGRIAELEAFSA